MNQLESTNWMIGRHIDNAGIWTLIAWFMGPTWGPSGADMTQVGPMLTPWTLLSGKQCLAICISFYNAQNNILYNVYLYNVYMCV